MTKTDKGDQRLTAALFPPREFTSIDECKHVYKDSSKCEDGIYALGLCRKHHAQELRGTRGHAREKTATGKELVSLTLMPDLVQRLDEITKETKESRSALVGRLLVTALSTTR